MTMTRLSHVSFGALLLLAALNTGCPQPMGDDPNDPNGVGSTPTEVTMDDTALAGLNVVLTEIPVFYDASLEVGNDLIAFGTGNLNGVAYVVPSEDPTVATAVPGTYASSGFAIAGAKILLADADESLAIYDSANETTETFADGVFFLDSVPGDDGDDYLSPIKTSDMLALTRNRASEVDDGAMLKLVDCSGVTAVVTPLVNPAANPSQIWIDAVDSIAIARAGQAFYIYDLTNLAAAPRAIDLSSRGGIGQGTRFAYDDGHILYYANSVTENLRLLTVAGETIALLDELPAQRDYGVAMAGGKFAYFLDRSGEFDEYSETDRDRPDVFAELQRSAIGLTPATAVTVGGIPGADPADVNLPWFAYGSDAAIPPRGDWIFLSGNEEVTVQVEYLQVSIGNAFAAFPLPDNPGFYIPATDVAASSSLVGFKTGVYQTTVLGWIVLP